MFLVKLTLGLVGNSNSDPDPIMIKDSGQMADYMQGNLGEGTGTEFINVERYVKGTLPLVSTLV